MYEEAPISERDMILIQKELQVKDLVEASKVLKGLIEEGTRR